MASHVPLHSFPTPEEAAEYVKTLPDTCAAGRRIELSGRSWKFKFLESAEDVPEEFVKPSYNTKDWDEVRMGVYDRLVHLHDLQFPSLLLQRQRHVAPNFDRTAPASFITAKMQIVAVHLGT